MYASDSYLPYQHPYPYPPESVCGGCNKPPCDECDLVPPEDVSRVLYTKDLIKLMKACRRLGNTDSISDRIYKNISYLSTEYHDTYDLITKSSKETLFKYWDVLEGMGW